MHDFRDLFKVIQGGTAPDHEADQLRHSGNPSGGAYANPLANYLRGAPSESPPTSGTPYGSNVATTNADLFPPPATLLPPRHPHDQPALPPSVRQLAAINRAQAIRPPTEPQAVRLGRYYDSSRTEAAWRYTAEMAADGTITPSVAGPVTAPITVPTTQLPEQVLSQYPGGIQARAVLTTFSYASTTTGATGALVWYWIDNGGHLIPLMCTSAADTSHQTTETILSKAALVDASGPALYLGQLYVKMVVGATPVQLAWQVGFSLAFLLPDEHPYQTRAGWQHFAEAQRHHEAAKQISEEEYAQDILS